MVGHLLLSLHHIEKKINEKNPFSNVDVVFPTVLRNRDSFFSGASVDIAIVFWEDKKIMKIICSITGRKSHLYASVRNPDPETAGSFSIYAITLLK